MAMAAKKIPKFQNASCWGSLKQAIEWVEQQQLLLQHLEIRPSIPYASLIKRCGDEKSLQLGARLHAHIAAAGAMQTSIGNQLVLMYGRCGDMPAARRVFQELSASRSAESWALLIAASIAAGDKAFGMATFRQLLCEGDPPPDGQCLSILLNCGGGAIASLTEARRLGSAMEGSELLADTPVVGSSLMACYKKLGGRLRDLESVFGSMRRRDAPAWEAMIGAYAETGRPRAALAMLRYMELEGDRPNVGALASLVDACAQLPALATGREIHARIMAAGAGRRPAAEDAILQSAIMAMYAKCGSVEEARAAFEQIRERNVIVWTSLVSAFARNGHSEEALRVFWKMEQEGESRADAITFTHVLYACAHGGMIDEAWAYLASMRLDRGIAPTVEHLGCMVDLLARAGRLREAEGLLNRAAAAETEVQNPNARVRVDPKPGKPRPEIRVRPDAAAWMCLLNACKIHGELDIGARAAARASELEPRRTGPYSVLSSMWAVRGDTVKTMVS